MSSSSLLQAQNSFLRRFRTRVSKLEERAPPPPSPAGRFPITGVPQTRTDSTLVSRDGAPLRHAPRTPKSASRSTH